MHLIFLILIPLLFLIWYVYTQETDATDINLQALAALQSKYVLLSSDKLDSKEFEKQKLEIIDSMNKTIKKELQSKYDALSSEKLDSKEFEKQKLEMINSMNETIKKELDSKEFEKQKLEIIDLINKSSISSKKDLSELQTTIAVITSLKSDSEKFQKYMAASTIGITDANAKIVSMAKDIANRVTKADLEQVRALLESKVSTTDVEKLSSLISSIESRLSGNLSKSEVQQMIMTKADQAAMENIETVVKYINSSISHINESTATKVEIEKVIENITNLNNLAKTNSDSIESVKKDTSVELSSLKNLISSLEGKEIANIIAQIDIIQQGLENKADVTVVTGIQNNLNKILLDIPELRNSIEIINKSLGKDAKLYYESDSSKWFKGYTNIRFAMNVKSGVIDIGYTDNYKGDKLASLTLDQFRRLLGDNYSSLNTGSLWFRTSKDINPGKDIKLGTAESYIAALLNLPNISSPDTEIQKTVFNADVIKANTDYNIKLSKTGYNGSWVDSTITQQWREFIDRLMQKSIPASAQLSSRMDCIIEMVIDFQMKKNASLDLLPSGEIQMKVYRDQANYSKGKLQPRIYMSGLIDASNGLIVSDPEYAIIENFGPVKAGASKSICPANSYMCGIENKAETVGIYPLCCSFSPGNSSFNM